MHGENLAYALLAGLVPSLIWLFFWLREDGNHPEPRSMLALSFFAGVAAVAIAAVGEQWLATVAPNVESKYFLWAACEEILKFLAVAIAALMSRYNDEPIDAMIYCIAAALGFAALENALFILNPLSTGNIGASIITGNMRFIGATLVHVVCSSIIGFSLGLTFYKKKVTKIISLFVGLIIAICLHTAFNLSIINAVLGDTLKSFLWVWASVVIVIMLFEEVKVVKPKKLSYN